jgi:hypothetical protein
MLPTSGDGQLVLYSNLESSRSPHHTYVVTGEPGLGVRDPHRAQEAAAHGHRASSRCGHGSSRAFDYLGGLAEAAERATEYDGAAQADQAHRARLKWSPSR